MKRFLLIFLLSVWGCGLHEKEALQPSGSKLQQIGQFHTEVAEPSGLSLAEGGQYLWTVNDPPSNKVYKIDLNGNIVQILDYAGDDLEGIVFDSTENVIWIAEEGKRELVKISLSGAELERHQIPFSGNSSHGFEGIALAKSGEFWVVNEKEPAVLIELDKDFLIKATFEPGVSSDLSGICADTTAGRFWLVSDESQLLFLWDRENGVIEQFSLPMKKAEGIAIDFAKGLFYIVSDSEQKLYVFKISS